MMITLLAYGVTSIKSRQEQWTIIVCAYGRTGQWDERTMNPMKYAHGFMVPCSVMIIDQLLVIIVIYLPIFIRVALKAMEQSYDCSRVNEVTLNEGLML